MLVGPINYSGIVIVRIIFIILIYNFVVGQHFSGAVEKAIFASKFHLIKNRHDFKFAIIFTE